MLAVLLKVEPPGSRSFISGKGTQEPVHLRWRLIQVGSPYMNLVAT